MRDAAMDAFRALEHTIEKNLGIRCSNYKEDYIKRRILSRMRSTGRETFEEYHRFLLSSQQEMEDLRNALTINVTKFFRDSGVFEVLRTKVFPDILQRRNRVHIWCAGCSSGEEAYTLAILLHDLIASRGTSDVSGLIYATDIDQEILKRAKEGIYTAKALENVSHSQLVRHFTQCPDGRYEVKPHLRDLIRFRHHDLMSGVPISRFLDCISCRNVTIYFTGNQNNDIARLFHGALVTGGYYVMGKTEHLSSEVEPLFSPYNALEKIYTKKE
jgi:chemotaxis protein methyltransferase CheR